MFILIHFLILFIIFRQFKNFCIHLNYNENILLILLSKALIFTKNKFKEQFDKEKKELNFLLIDPILKRAIV